MPDHPNDEPAQQLPTPPISGSSGPLTLPAANGIDGGGTPMGTLPSTYVYAVGRVEPRFPSLALEKEFAQAVGRSGTTGLTDRQALQSALSQRTNRYLARQFCWVLTIEGLETYLLAP